MSNIFVFIILLTLSLLGREEVFPLKECPAFNNMKHTQNTHNVILNLSTKYTILRHHKGQALLLIKGEQPAQRWVDDTCFLKENKEVTLDEVTQSISAMLEDKQKKSIDVLDTKRDKYKSRKVSQHTLLALSWHNAFCETKRFKKECKRPRFPMSSKVYKEQHFVLHGLWPQPKSNHYCNVDNRIMTLDKHKQWHKLPDLNLSDNVKKSLSYVMPGVASNLHKHQWVKHGTCYGTDVTRYFRDAIRLVREVNDSKVGNFFQKHIGRRVTLQQVRTVFNRSFGVGTGSRVELRCRGGLITELWLHLAGNANDIASLLKKGKVTRSRCQSGILDKAGF